MIPFFPLCVIFSFVGGLIYVLPELIHNSRLPSMILRKRIPKGKQQFVLERLDLSGLYLTIRLRQLVIIDKWGYILSLHHLRNRNTIEESRPVSSTNILPSFQLYWKELGIPIPWNLPQVRVPCENSDYYQIVAQQDHPQDTPYVLQQLNTSKTLSTFYNLVERDFKMKVGIASELVPELDFADYLT